MNYRIIIPEKEEELQAYYKLRYEILRKAWGQSEHTTRDEWENQSLHVLMVDENGKGVATGRLQYNSDTEAQIRSMGVTEELRGQGLGSRVLKFLEEKAREKNYRRLTLDARDNAVNFYKRNGYTVFGDSYTLFDIIPHFKMGKEL